MINAARIDSEWMTDWQGDGWLVVPNFLSMQELDELRGEADRLMQDDGLFRKRGAVPNSATRSDRLDPVVDVSPVIADLASKPRLLALLAEVLGGQVQLLKDKFIAKPPGAIGYGVHQDAAYWPGLGVDPSRFLSAILFLDDATVENGAIECCPGRHGALLTDPDVIADPDEASLGPFVTVEARAGDLLLLHALTPHRSGPNRSSGMRRAILLTYGVDDRDDLYGIYRGMRRNG